MSDYPVALTRSLERARAWLRHRTRGTRRSGFLACSGGRRLRPYGIDVINKVDEASWFLRPPEDIRSSCFLEVVATEFAVQGLEVDWAGVCWDADLRWTGSWRYHRFSGTKWQKIKNETKRRFLLNKYRVLLTRSREGMVIWIPQGSLEDPTRKAAYYDGTADYLLNCGANFLDD